MEAAMVNVTAPGEKALVTILGKFSERLRELGEAFGLDLVLLEAEWGTPVAPERVQAAFDEHPDIRTVFCTHCETSTGTLQDVAAFAKIAHSQGALIVVDGITSLGSEDVQTDHWGLDMVVGGSQKGLMIPPGLAFLSVSQAAKERMERGNRHPVFYFDLLKALASLEKSDTPWTPATTLIIALQEALTMMREEGFSEVIHRHATNAAAVRAAVTAMKLPLFSTAPANCTTVITPPDGTAPKIKSTLEERYGLSVAGGQGHVKGKILRLGHLGYYYEADMLTLISSLESVMNDMGLHDNVGVGLAAMHEAYRTGVKA
jgi:aspartate aminotransferase-like enzyme